jgi:hypothetical protein
MKNRAAEIHAGLKHPVIDGDGHWLEPVPVFLEYLREVGGAQSVGRMSWWRRGFAGRRGGAFPSVRSGRSTTDRPS